MNYPEWKEGSDKVSHLLFDIGYSYGLLNGAEEFLGRLLEHPSVVMPARVKLDAQDILDALRSFKFGRMGLVTDIYAAAPEAVERLSRAEGLHRADPA
jgi:hypothetical protein